MPQLITQISEDGSSGWNDGLSMRFGRRFISRRLTPEVHVDAEKNIQTLEYSESTFWFNNLHDDFLRRLRTHRRFSSIRAIYLALLALHVAYDDLRVWNRLYGPVGAIAVVILAKKSIWTMQVEVLASIIDEIQWGLSISPGRFAKNISEPAGNSGITAGRQPAGKPHRENEPQINESECSSPERRSPHSPSTLDSASYASTFEQARRNGLLNSHPSLDRPHRSPLDEAYDPTGGGQAGRAGALPPPQFSVAGLELKKAIQDESARIGTSGGIITAVAMAALALPNVSQTHWVARSCWTSSMVTALLAVYFSNNQAWTISQLSSEQKLRAWIKDIDPEDDYEATLQTNFRDKCVDDLSVLLDNLTPAPSSTITISAPSLLLSSSLLLLLSGIGVFLAFVWTRMTDTDAGTSSSRDVFITYIVTLGASLGTVAFFSLGRVAVPLRQSIVRNMRRIGINAPKNSSGKCGDGKEILAHRRLPSTDDIREIGDPHAADLEVKDDDGYTPLLLAAVNGDEAVVKQLLEKGADLESKDDDGRTPLLRAARSGHEAGVKLLLQKGADLESKDNDGLTPLLCAVRLGFEAVVKQLLEKVLDLEDLEARDHDGRTLLSWADGNGYHAVVDQLLEKIAELKRKDKYGDYDNDGEPAYLRQTLMQDGTWAQDSQNVVEELSGDEMDNKIQKMEGDTQGKETEIQEEDGMPTED